WGLSDAQSRVVHHLIREVRVLCRTAKPSRTDKQLEGTLSAGITFALGLSQAFDTVSRHQMLDLLQDLGAEPALLSLIHGLHRASTHRLHSQGTSVNVETTTGIKQACILVHSLIAVVGIEAVQNCLTGYADDFTVHRHRPTTGQALAARSQSLSGIQMGGQHQDSVQILKERMRGRLRKLRTRAANKTQTAGDKPDTEA
ncbi:unnamed protein product, partial [Symbiodinium sp. CCMP2456]